MDTTTILRDLTSAEVCQRGREIYDRTIRHTVEPQRRGDVVLIDIDTGDCEFGGPNEVVAASDRLRERRPGGRFYLKRIGYQASAAIGTVLK